MRVIDCIGYNWLIDAQGFNCTEWAYLGINGVKSIREQTDGYGALQFYEVEYDSGNIMRIHNPNTVILKRVEEPAIPEAVAYESLEDLPF